MSTDAGTPTPRTDALVQTQPNSCGLSELAEAFNQMLDHARQLERELTALRAAHEAAQAESVETYFETICPRCDAEFESDHAVVNTFCPECKGDMRGVLNSRQRKRLITQEQWDAAQAEIESLRVSFAHYHANYGDGSDTCKECGLDLRNPVHFTEYRDKQIAKYSARKAK